MGIHHKVELVIKIIDGFTNNKLLIGPNTFYINKNLIRPDKVMESYFIFCNLNGNKKIGEVDDLAWRHPYYQTVSFGKKELNEAMALEEIIVRAMPSMNYPYPKGTTIIRGSLNQPANILFVHAFNRTKFILQETVLMDKYITLSTSIDQYIEGKFLRFSEDTSEQIVQIFKDNIGFYTDPKLEYDYTEACAINEVIRTQTDDVGHFNIAFDCPSVEEAFLEIDLLFEVKSGIKNLPFKIKKDAVNDVGKIVL